MSTIKDCHQVSQFNNKYQTSAVPCQLEMTNVPLDESCMSKEHTGYLFTRANQKASILHQNS